MTHVPSSPNERKPPAFVGTQNLRPGECAGTPAPPAPAAGSEQELQKVLGELLQAGLGVRTKGNRYILPGEADLISGRILMNRSGKSRLNF